jgi:hypothetical protein
MDTTAVSGAGAGRPNRRSDFGGGRLFLADSRLALGALNYCRYQGLNRVFGVQREQANLLTFVLLAGAGVPAVVGLWRAVRAPLAMATGANAGVGAFALRQATRGVVGPGASEVPQVEALLALAVAGGVAIPQLRRAFRGVRKAEHRVRQQRESMYGAARVAMRRDQVAAGSMADPTPPPQGS